VLSVKIYKIHRTVWQKFWWLLKNYERKLIGINRRHETAKKNKMPEPVSGEN